MKFKCWNTWFLLIFCFSGIVSQQVDDHRYNIILAPAAVIGDIITEMVRHRLLF